MSVLSVLAKRCLVSPQTHSTSRISIRQFRQVRKSPRVDQSSKKGPVLESETSLPPAPWSSLVRPALFTAGFGVAAMAGCSVWQYENMRSEALKAKMMNFGFGWKGDNTRKVGEFREEVRKWWESLRTGEKLYWKICGLNVIVFLAWRVPVLQPFMMKWFLSSPASTATCLPMLLSTFSHFSGFHLFFNMMALHSFTPMACELLGQEQFLAVYLSSGVAASFASMVYKVSTKSTGFSLGASGAILCVVGMYAAYFPESRFSIIFLPMYTFSAATAIKGLMAVDAAGLVMGWRFLDHAAHLAGVVSGLGWAYYGSHSIWAQREGLVTAWHNFRTGR